MLLAAALTVRAPGWVGVRGPHRRVDHRGGGRRAGRGRRRCRGRSRRNGVGAAAGRWSRSSSTAPADRPLRLVDALLYLDRYWGRSAASPRSLDAAAPPHPARGRRRPARRCGRPAVPGDDSDRQRLAAAVAAHRWVSVLAGGPGTGKTTTVAKLLAVLEDQPGPPLRVALAAPTGKAAARLTEAVAAVTQGLAAEDRDRLGTLTASTLHRLLGWRPGARGRFRHDASNRLPYDVVVVDEASTVSLTLMSRLAEALRSDSRLVLVGDPDQLASVEAGAVLGDLVVARATGTDDGGALEAPVARDLTDLDAAEREGALRGGVVRLSHVHWFSGGIKALAEAIRSGDAGAVRQVLDEGYDDVEHLDVDPGATSELPRAPRTRSRPGERWSPPPGPATPASRCRCSTTTGCCAPTARAPTASSAGAGRSRSGCARRSTATVPAAAGTSAARCS